MFSFLKFPSKVGHWPKWSNFKLSPFPLIWASWYFLLVSKTGKTYFICCLKILEVSNFQVTRTRWSRCLCGPPASWEIYKGWGSTWIYGKKIMIILIIIFHRQKVREALDSGQPVNSRSPGGVTGLMYYFEWFWRKKKHISRFKIFYRYAASGGHNAILHLLLLQPGIDINTPDQYVDLWGLVSDGLHYILTSISTVLIQQSPVNMTIWQGNLKKLTTVVLQMKFFLFFEMHTKWILGLQT